MDENDAVYLELVQYLCVDLKPGFSRNGGDVKP